MKEGELRKLRREDLLLILIDQQRQIDALTETLEQRDAELENRRVAIKSSGSLAEAAFRLNDVYAAAQKAADMYLDEMRARADETLAKARKVAGELILKANDELHNADELLEKARGEADNILAEARRKAEEIDPQGADSPQGEALKGKATKRIGLFRRRS